MDSKHTSPTEEALQKRIAELRAFRSSDGIESIDVAVSAIEGWRTLLSTAPEGLVVLLQTDEGRATLDHSLRMVNDCLETVRAQRVNERLLRA